MEVVKRLQDNGTLFFKAVPWREAQAASVSEIIPVLGTLPPTPLRLNLRLTQGGLYKRKECVTLIRIPLNVSGW